MKTSPWILLIVLVSNLNVSCSNVSSAETTSSGWPAFGLTKGMKPSDLRDLTPLSNHNNFYTTRHVPNERAGFANYTLCFAPHTGLYAVIADTAVVEANDEDTFYTAIMPTYSAITGTLKRAYGTGDIKGFDSVAVGWNHETSPKLERSIQQIVVDIMRTTVKSGFVRIEYRFSNYNEGDRENSGL